MTVPLRPFRGERRFDRVFGRPLRVADVSDLCCRGNQHLSAELRATSPVRVALTCSVLETSNVDHAGTLRGRA